jgi:prepilin-type N-terminal cleavage/methylation domain-containing protein
MNRRYIRSGFSLIEVVAALALFSMAAVVLSDAFVNALLARERGTSNDARNRDIRAVRMQLLLEPDREAAEDGGAYETLGNGTANWRAEIEPTNVIDLFQVQLLIDFQEPQDDQEATYRERLYLLRPTWSESDERSNLLQEKKDALLDRRNFDRF